MSVEVLAGKLVKNCRTRQGGFHERCGQAGEQDVSRNNTRTTVDRKKKNDVPCFLSQITNNKSGSPCGVVDHGERR